MLLPFLIHSFVANHPNCSGRNLSSAKHNGVRSFFHKNFVKTSIIAIELGHFYDKLFDNRQKADYADLIRFELDTVQPWFEQAQQFVYITEDLIKKEINL